MMPEPMRTARRAAISLPSAEDGTSTAAGDTASYAAWSASTFGTTRYSVNSGASAVRTLTAPCSASAAAVLSAPAAESDGDRLADAAGQGQQFKGGLADGTVHVVDVDQNFSHGTSISCKCEETAGS